MRYVCQFSCGAASAVATRLILSEILIPSMVEIVNAYIEDEDKDNRRFLADCEKWFGRKVTVLRDEKYGASALEVWRRKRYIKGPNGAPCSQELKRKLLGKFLRPGDVNVMGFTREEADRFYDIQERWPDEEFKAPLIERDLSKDDCYSIVDRAGIVLPLMYRKGYDNANCKRCPKGGQAYWQNIREDFPEMFAPVMELQDELGPGSYFLQFRSGPRKGERMSLRELPPGRGNMKEEPSFSCSFFCDMAIREITSPEPSTDPGRDPEQPSPTGECGK